MREDWRPRSYAERATILRDGAAHLREQADALAALATQETGKLLVDALAEVQTSAAIIEYFADHGEAMLAPRSFDAKPGQAIVEPRPIGPIFCIEPWNLPYYQLARVAGPQLTAGNTLAVKQASSVPPCALAFEAALRDVGVPEGAYANLSLSDEQAASVIADERIAGVALTGSANAGKAVASRVRPPRAASDATWAKPIVPDRIAFPISVSPLSPRELGAGSARPAGAGVRADFAIRACEQPVEGSRLTTASGRV